ncbi:hypothetical protein [Cohnella phaseoli]|nr:hypothetical protein [Cohnella phaseoli]
MIEEFGGAVLNRGMAGFAFLGLLFGLYLVKRPSANLAQRGE